MRVFSAIDVESEELQEELSEVRDRLSFNFRKVPAKKMHLTLQFFEDVSEKEVEQLREAIGNAEVEPFSAPVKGVGVFPSEDHVRVVWAGVESEKIHELKRQVSQHSVNSSSNHDFTPHITLMRVGRISRKDRKKFWKSFDEYRDHSFGTFHVNSVKLFETVKTSDGSRYRVLEEFDL